MSIGELKTLHAISEVERTHSLTTHGMSVETHNFPNSWFPPSSKLW